MVSFERLAELKRLADQGLIEKADPTDEEILIWFQQETEKDRKECDRRKQCRWQIVLRVRRKNAS